MDDSLVCITGSTDGIGRAAAFRLASEGIGLVLHGRSEERLDALLGELATVDGCGSLLPVVADFRSLEAVEGMAAAILASKVRFGALINNAGIYMPQRVLTGDGFETTFAVNYLAHVHLTLLLEPLLVAGGARIVNVSSVDHRSADFDPGNMQGERCFSGYQAYAFSKLCNIMFTIEHASMLDGSKVTSNALDPGVLDTKLLHAGWPLAGQDPAAGGDALCRLALSPEFEGVSGGYFEDGRLVSCSSAALDPLRRRQLWECTMDMLARKK
ncbi:hypothetical protein CHL67_09605 [Prosthecochloris sp. GSB1]|uniref:SDR family NAD(P)-dependent oxidoreductase n=1 Tax=Prosthecochloris sp. GSB1 TaxID=281093 RepID=UPI000B8CBBC2|nr:SDR family NAD(P)-dependent oxidoreductase [Prosthecochloris sp. GSB1]ASQ91138.1 hypothetical protein CHL67_09605 [Prosthecochloris sp. GSB1]